MQKHIHNKDRLISPIKISPTYEMPTALQALRQADRFLFEKEPNLDNTYVFIHFISNNPLYNKIYDFGVIDFFDIKAYHMNE
ncbi:MAG: staygreen family protein [Velocimicrobium sp.]